MKKTGTIAILDGYNVIHKIPRLQRLLGTSLRKAREGLVRMCSTWTATRRDISQFYIVFDGDSNADASETHSAPGVRIFFSRSGESADDKILALVEELERFSRSTVVSDDKYVRHNATRLDAKVISPAEFDSLLRKKRARTQPESSRADKGLTPEQKRSINEGLKKAWNIE